MPQFSGFFNDLNGDRLYGAEELARFYRNMLSNGLYTTSTEAYKLTQGSGLSFTIGNGAAMIDGYFHAVEGTEVSLSLTPASGGLNRIDILVLELVKTQADRAVRLRVLQGTPLASPNPPFLSDSGLVVQIPLYEFRVNSGVTSWAGITITDRRYYSLNTGAWNILTPNLPNGTNLNSVQNGNYFLENPASLINCPTTQVSMLETFRSTNGRLQQRVTEIFAGSASRDTIFQRSSANGGSTWSSWTATYSDKQQTFTLNPTGGATASGDAKYSIIGDRVRIEAILVLPSGMAAGTTIGQLTASATPSSLTYIAPIIANNGQRVQIAIQSSGAVQVGNSITSNTSISIFDDFLRTPIR